MSLINDALRRASQTDKNRAPPAAGPSGMTPAPARERSKTPLILGAVVALLAVAAGWLIWRALAVERQERQERVVVAPAAPVVAKAPASVISAAERAAEVVPKAEAPRAAAEAGKVEVAVAATAMASPAPRPFPSLKLQAIFFNRSNPHALINGRTVGEGDEVLGTRVKRIEAEKVTVEWEGETKALEMGSP